MDEVIEIGGARVLHCAKEGALLAREADINDFIGTAFSHQADVVAIPVERLGPDFLKLSTGLAGATFQKLVRLGPRHRHHTFVAHPRAMLTEP